MKFEDGNVLEGIRNGQLVCADCKHRFDDSKKLRNTAICEEYPLKPISVLCGGNCLKYERGEMSGKGV